MLTEKHLENYADVLWWGLTTARRQRFRKGDLVQIRFHSGALRLAEILHRKLIEKGLQPIIRLARTADMESSFYHLAGRQQLAFIPPGEANLSQRLNGSIFLNAPESLTHLRTAAPESIAAAAIAAHPLRTLLETREIRGDYAWTLTAGRARSNAGWTGCLSLSFKWNPPRPISSSRWGHSGGGPGSRAGTSPALSCSSARTGAGCGACTAPTSRHFATETGCAACAWNSRTVAWCGPLRPRGGVS